MGGTAKTLIPRLMRDSTEPTSETALCLDDLLVRMRTVNLNEIRHLSRFVPVIVLIPESSVHGETVQPKIACNGSSNETADLAKILGISGKPTEQLRTPSPNGEFLFGQVSVNFREMSSCRNGEPVVLTAMEFKVLKYLIQNARRVISRDELLNEVWGYENFPRTRTVDNHILRLRQKLEQHPCQPVHIRTVRGAGYKFLP